MIVARIIGGFIILTGTAVFWVGVGHCGWLIGTVIYVAYASCGIYILSFDTKELMHSPKLTRAAYSIAGAIIYILLWFGAAFIISTLKDIIG